MKNNLELSRQRGRKLLIRRKYQVEEPRGVRSMAFFKASVGKMHVQGSQVRQGSERCEPKGMRRGQSMQKAET